MSFEDVIVVPAEEFPGLDLREIISLGDVEYGDCEATSTDEVDEVMVREVHRGPPNPHDVGT